MTTETTDQPAQSGRPPRLAPVGRLLTTDEAAEMLAVSVRTVKTLMADGRLAFVKIGAATRIDQADLDEYVRRNRRKHRHPVRGAR